uniref:Uncharacterized protein n=1 Tax=Kalanchoe fedtschenkoi TaxID=63787 RepID=A0A7N0V5H3_KALFE
MLSSLQNPTFTSPGVFPFSTHQNPCRTQIRNPIVCARRRRRQFLNRKTSKLMLDTALAVASNLSIVPPPLTALIREFGGGNGGGSGFRTGGGGGGFGWRRGRGRNLGFVLLVVVIGLGFGAGGKVHSDVVWCGLGLALIGGAIGCWDVRVADWVMGFCGCAGVVGFLGLMREEVSRWVQKIRACVSELRSMGMVRGAKSGRRRAF